MVYRHNLEYSAMQIPSSQEKSIQKFTVLTKCNSQALTNFKMKIFAMGHVHAEIEIINGGDIELVRRGYIDKDEIKRMWITELVDSDSFMLAINQNIQ